MPRSPYFKWIQLYLPPEEWERADCISTRECSPDRLGYPYTCVGEEGNIDCMGNPVPNEARSWGPFQILDVCWNPALNPNSPFTEAQWAQVLDPNVNTWMASVIWSRSGWNAWTTCTQCESCQVAGGPIPYPDAPVIQTAPPPYYEQAPNQNTLSLVAGLGLIAIGIGIVAQRSQP